MPDALVPSLAALPQWTLLYGGLNGLLSFVLAFRVSQLRMKSNVIFGDGGDGAIQRAIRAHANNVEYVPLTLVLIGLLEIAGQPAWAINAMGAALFIGRALHAIGLTSTEDSSPPRFYGILLTWAALVAAALWCIVAALTL
ncbi:MAG: MAPEG family protein [Zavarzinia sp.]|nr:MAPEG family protein [Zavarzinia sp.]